MDNVLIRSLRSRLYDGRTTRIPPDMARAEPTHADTWLLGHILRTHASLRLLIGLIAVCFPFVLWAIGYFVFGQEMPGSISEYYWHPYRPYVIDRDYSLVYLVGDAPVRVFFVGGLIAIGFFLIGYRGYSKGENLLHTLSGLCAIGVALFPMSPCRKDEPVCAIERLGNILYGHDPIHFVSATLLFFFLGLVIICYSKNTLQYFGNRQWQKILQRTYYSLAGLMWIVPILTYLAFGDHFGSFGKSCRTLIYWIEIFAIVPFGLYWLIKTSEIRLSEYDYMLAKGIPPPP